MADSELAAKLAKRQQKIGEAVESAEEERSREKPKEKEEKPVVPTSSNGSRSVSESSEHEQDISNSASAELRNRLTHRQNLNEGVEQPRMGVHGSVYAEFHEFSRKQIKGFEKSFRTYDENKDNFLCFEELKRMMEKLGEPQTHLALKEMIREVDEDKDLKISFREFLLIFRKAAAGELKADSGLSKLANLAAVDVTKEGVCGAKNFFEAKIEQLTQSNAFEAEIRAEQQEKKKEAEEKKIRRQEFRNKQSVFQ